MVVHSKENAVDHLVERPYFKTKSYLRDNTCTLLFDRYLSFTEFFAETYGVL